MGILVGTYYTIHFINCGSLYECIIMHLVNNFFSSLLSRSTTLEDIGKIDVLVQCLFFLINFMLFFLFINCCFFVLVTWTVLFFSAMIYHESKFVLEKQNCNFKK